jgi:hypothetical protein
MPWANPWNTVPSVDISIDSAVLLANSNYNSIAHLQTALPYILAQNTTNSTVHSTLLLTDSFHTKFGII